MNRCILAVLVVVLLTLAACSPTAPSAPPAPSEPPTPMPALPAASGPTAVPTLGLATLDTARLAGSPSPSADGAGVKAWLREMTGLHEQLSPEAIEIFRLMDQAESEALQDVLDQLKSRTKPKGMPAPLPPRINRALGAEQFVALANALTALSNVTNLISRPEDREPDGPLPANESTKEMGENVQALVRVQPTVTGCHAEIDIQVTVRAEKDGIVYEDKAKGHISMTVCPDEAGQVPLDLTMDGQVNIKDVHLSLSFVDHAIGHVDDEGNLASIDSDIESELDVPTGKNWFTGAPSNSSVRVRQQFSRRGADIPKLGDGSVERTGGSVLDASFPPSQDVANRAAVLGPYMVWIVEKSAFEKAENKWKDNYCVAITGVDDNQYVLIGSETPFTASVRHQWEGKDLNVPVIATLTEGEVSVTPAGSKVPAPATFRYKAPEESSFRPAVVELVSRSRRGIAKFNANFNIQDQFYTVNGAWANSEITVSGTICALDKPFNLKLGGRKPNGTPYTGKVEFTPTDATRGSWKAEGTYTIPYTPPTYDSAASTYQVTGLPDGKPMIKLDAFTQKGHSAVFSASFDWPGMDIPLIVRTGICYSD